jgi:hypothetical protein
MLITPAGPLAAFLILAAQAPQAQLPDVLTAPADGASMRVEVGIYLVDLTAVDGAEQSFRADVLVQVVWRDPRLASTSTDAVRLLNVDSAWHPRVEIVNRRAIERTLGDELRLSPDGTVSYAQRFVGTFSSPMNLREFPLDRQRFYIQVVVGHADAEDMNVEPPRSDAMLAGRSEELSVSDWRIGPAHMETMPLTLSSSIELQGMALVMEGRRELRYYVVQVILPLMMIVTMAWTVFWIDPSVIPTRIGTVVTTMLTLIAYRFALSSFVPRLPYLTRLDWFMVGSTSLILATLLTMAAAAYLKSRGRDELVLRIDRWGRVCFAITALAIWTVPWIV